MLDKIEGMQRDPAARFWPTENDVKSQSNVFQQERVYNHE